jgi:PIN domain nuclease of toxin-antitoxin system
VTTVLLDTHTLHWWTAEPELLSRTAAKALDEADELAVASVSWYELAWLAHHGRIKIAIPVLSWLQTLAAQVRTIATSPEIAATAVSLPVTFPSDPVDRVIFATAFRHGWMLVTRDERIRAYRHSPRIAVW